MNTCICGHKLNQHSKEGCSGRIYERCETCGKQTDESTPCPCKKFQSNWYGTPQQEMMERTGLWHRPYGNG